MSTLLDELTARIERMPPSEVAKLASLASAELARPFVPNPGPQTDALLSKADQLLYGGAAGGGKSYLSLGLAASYHRRSLVLRRESTELDGLIADSKTMLEGRGRFVGGNDNEWHLSDGRHIKLGGMKEPDDWKKYRGDGRDLMVFDEAESFLESQVSSLLGWLRTTVLGQRCRAVFATNPPTTAYGQWLLEWFAPWLDPTFHKPAKPGELRWCLIISGKTEWVDGPGEYDRDGEMRSAISRTFIPAFLSDNPFLADTDYAKRIDNMPEPLRSQLKYGSFTAGKSDQERQVIPSEWIDAAQARWTADKCKGPMSAIGVDVAQGGSDNTILAPLYGNVFGEMTTRPGAMTRNGPDVAALVIGTRKGRAAIIIDCTGGWGGSARDVLESQNIMSVPFVASAACEFRIKGGAELGFYNLRAASWWRLREALDPDSDEDIALPPDPALKAELCMPTWTVRKDKILIESKDDIRKRLGRSTDRADAAIMAWFYRDEIVDQSQLVTFERRKGLV